jgi:hypothetical protein
VGVEVLAVAFLVTAVVTEAVVAALEFVEEMVLL